MTSESIAPDCVLEYADADLEEPEFRCGECHCAIEDPGMCDACLRNERDTDGVIDPARR